MKLPVNILNIKNDWSTEITALFKHGFDMRFTVLLFITLHTKNDGKASDEIFTMNNHHW